MDEGLLVASQLSSLFPSSQIASIPIQTSRRNTPLAPPPKQSDPPAEHAIYSSVLNTQITGTILLRVIHGGLILELVSLSSTETAPIRFVFPSALLSYPAIFLWNTNELHVLAVTRAGSLYRLVLPLGSGGQFGQDHVGSNWCREYLIKGIPEEVSGLVQIQGTHCVIIGLPNGSLLRLETESLGDDSHNDQWSEFPFQHTSFLTSLTAFLHSGPSDGTEIISMATHPQPTDIGHVWTLSRDRMLRLWTARSGCIAAKQLSSTFSGRASTPVPSTSTNAPKPQTLLDAEHQLLLRIFSMESEGEHPFVLAFVPASSSSSGGFFQLFSTMNDQLEELGMIECSRTSAHCHLQDFMVHGTTLYTLWDRQGQSAVEYTVFDPNDLVGRESGHEAWRTATYAQESELTPAYLDELLLSPGSLTDKFLEAIMRPGTFSSLTLRTAIDQYTQACLSLPGPPPPQLTTPYTTLGENIAAVVGCTVNLVRDPHTGVPQHSNYWNALKRDWEGFIARCREVERSARWPLALGVDEFDPKGKILVVERERVGSLEIEDLPLRLHRLLAAGTALDPPFTLLDIVWTLHTKLGNPLVLNIENRLVDIMHQEIAFSFADIVQDQAQRSHFREGLEEGLESWIGGRLASIDELDPATRIILDIVANVVPEVKREEDEIELLLPPNSSHWTRALTANYVSTSINARYELCLSLMTFLFFVADDLQLWDPSLLAEVFSVFRGIAMLRYVARQPAADVPAAVGTSNDAADDVVAYMRDMQVSQTRSRSSPAHSLIYGLLAQPGDSEALPSAAHYFLDTTGLLQSTSPALVTKSEVLFCEQLRLLGYHQVTRELLAWLPRTAGVSYVMARLWLNVGRADDAAHLMDKLAGVFATENSMTADDQEALAAVLPGAQLFDSDYNFYIHAATLFKSAGLAFNDVRFSQMALSVAPPGTDEYALRFNIINGYTNLGLFDDAYATLITTPSDKLKRECVNHLVYRMCEENAVEKLMTYNFASFADEVEDALAFKVRNVDPRIRPFYSKILYTWYVLRGDYRNAALTMYQRARKLHRLVGDPRTFLELAEEQLESYMIAMNAISLLERKNAWIVMPTSADDGHEPRKRRKLSKHIPENKFAPGKYDAEIVELADMQFDYALLAARLDLVQKDPLTLSAGEFQLSPSSIVLRMAQANRFNTAIATARSLQVDMTDLFAHLTGQCLRLSRNPDAVIQQDTSDWLLTDNVSSWPGTPADRGWRYLRQSLERHDNVATDFKYSKITLETILGFDRSSPPPPWLIHILEKHHHEYLVRISLRYEVLENALEHVVSLIRESDARLAREPPKNASATWLPYTLIDQVLVAAASQSDLSPRSQALRQELQTTLANRVKRMQKLSQFSH